MALVDSGAQTNYMLYKTAKRLGISSHWKSQLYLLVLAIGEIGIVKGVDKESGPLYMQVGNHVEIIEFDLAPLRTHKVILGMSWIAKHNPSID